MSELHVICLIGDTEYAIPASDVLQMESYVPITPVPGSPNYVMGVVQIRQQVIPVIDPKIRFGLPATQIGAETRFVILKIETRTIGLLVDRAREVRSFKSEDFTSAAGILAHQAMGFVKSVAQLKDRIILLIDGLKLVGEEASHG